MKKPFTLRQHLLACNKSLKSDPEKLQVYLDAGTIAHNLPASLSFGYNYTLNIIVTDFSEHPNSIIVPLLVWLKVNQIDLGKDAVNFEADILDSKTIDLSITVLLDEKVIVAIDQDGNHTATLRDEPMVEYNLPTHPLFKQLIANDELITPSDV